MVVYFTVLLKLWAAIMLNNFLVKIKWLKYEHIYAVLMFLDFCSLVCLVLEYIYSLPDNINTYMYKKYRKLI